MRTFDSFVERIAHVATVSVLVVLAVAVLPVALYAIVRLSIEAWKAMLS